MSKQKGFFGLKSRTLVLAILFVCACALVGTAAELSKQKAVKSEARLVEVANTPVRIMFNGNETYRISLDGKTFSRELAQRNEIKLNGLEFDPLVNPPRQDMSRGMAAGDVNLYIVQCIAQAVVPFQKQISQAGGEICGALSDNSLIVLMSGETGAAVKAMSFVRWAGPYLSVYKTNPAMTDNIVTPLAAAKNRYVLWLAKKDKKDNVVDLINSLGGEVVVATKGRRIDANLDPNQLDQVVASPYVLAADRWTAPENDMNNAREISGANYLESIKGYTGQGVRAEVCDGGIRATHVDFQANPPIFHSSNSTDTSHGTSVYGIVFGSGTGSANGRGLLPNAEQPIFAAYGSLTDRYAHTAELINPGGAYRAVFQTNSWGDTRTFYYTTISADMDDILFHNDFLILQSQSNAGTQDSRPQAWAKNILSIGGWNHYDTLGKTDDCWCYTASIGPASDGRIKPELSHFYDYTYTTYYSSDTAYTNFGGTSGATPITAGYAGLFFQMWADGVLAGGPGQNRDVFNSRPHAMTSKALLIHTASQYTFSGTTHDMTRVHQGWGMIDVKNLYDMAASYNWTFPILIDESDVINPLETHTYTLNASGTTPLRATMVYADPPGVPLSAVHRINDLSLKVTSPTGTIYWGNNGLLAGNWSTSGGSSNTIDTVENVFIQNPAAGNWTIQVLADVVVEDGHLETPEIDADYALVVTGGTTSVPTPPAAPTDLTATVASCSQINLGWTDNSGDETSFKIERSTDGSNFSEIASVGANVTSYNNTGLTAGTTYYYRVRAYNGGGYSGYTNTANAATPVCPPAPPAAPSNLTATPGRNNVALNWTDNSNNETGFRVYRGTTSSNLVLIATVGANVTTYNNTGLARRTTYYYKVCAYNAEGESCSATIQTKTK